MTDLAQYWKSFFRWPVRKHRSFSELFEDFKTVLESNNETLELITDMGEKLGGEYLFDIVYVRKAYTQLSEALSNSIRCLQRLTRNRYPHIQDAYSRIDGQIRRMVDGSAIVFPDPVVFYENMTWDLSYEVGGKNASLAELKNHSKLNIPDGFAITAAAYETFMKKNRLDEMVLSLREEPDPSEARLQDLRESILGGEIPEALEKAIQQAVQRMRETYGKNCHLAVRSSAEEEDGEYSFAGQFETVLNVPLEEAPLHEAYKQVVASLFSTPAVAYQKRLGYVPGHLRMAVGCMRMVDAVASGVMYTTHPNGDPATLLINATWGLGRSIVEGQADADSFVVKKEVGFPTETQSIGEKDAMIVPTEEGGVIRKEVSAEEKARPSLSRAQIEQLATYGLFIEKYFQKPQDIEWAMDSEGTLFILQARALRIPETIREKTELPEEPEDAQVLLRGKGLVVQKGIAAGRVFRLKRLEDLEAFPKGAVLVARHDASQFVRVMPYVSAIITETGSLTSHMASLCREFRIPTVVNVGNVMDALRHGEEVTLRADEDRTTAVYHGIVRPLLEYAEINSVKMEEVYEFRRKRYILRYVTPLNLIDPLMDNFTADGCKTFHDILRFIHEKAVTELVESSRFESHLFRKRTAVQLDLPIAAGIMIMDMGGGLRPGASRDKVAWDEVTSVPLNALLRGIMFPGAWHTDAVPLQAKDFLTSMMKSSDITAAQRDYPGYNVAVTSKDYVHLNLRFGYHFNVLDCYCSSHARNNHIYFRFVGGATDIVKRSRRVRLISDVLKEYGFGLKTKGDLVVARLTNIQEEEEQKVLEEVGKLISYTRQLDALLFDDEAVQRYTRKFLAGDFRL